MKLRLWQSRASRSERNAKRETVKQRAHSEMSKVRKTRSRAYEPHNQNQGYGTGFGGGG